MFKPKENKAIDEVTRAIETTERAIEQAKAEADAKTEQLEAYKRRQFEQARANMRPGQTGVFLPPDRDRDQLEREAVLARAKVFSLERQLSKILRAYGR